MLVEAVKFFEKKSISQKTVDRVSSVARKMQNKFEYKVSSSGYAFESSYLTQVSTKDSKGDVVTFSINPFDKSAKGPKMKYKDVDFEIDCLEKTIQPSKIYEYPNRFVKMLKRVFPEKEEVNMNSAMPVLTRALKVFDKHLEDVDKVSQQRLGIRGVTQKGAASIEQAQEKLGYLDIRNA